MLSRPISCQFPSSACLHSSSAVPRTPAPVQHLQQSWPVCSSTADRHMAVGFRGSQLWPQQLRHLVRATVSGQQTGQPELLQQSEQQQQQPQQQQQDRQERQKRQPRRYKKPPQLQQPQQQPQQQQSAGGPIGQQRTSTSAPSSEPTNSTAADSEEGWFVEQPLGSWAAAPTAVVDLWGTQPGQQQQQHQLGGGSDDDWLVMHELQQWMQEAEEAAAGAGPVLLVSSSYSNRSSSRDNSLGSAWFHAPQYLKPSALHAELMARSGRNQLEVAALLQLLRISSTPREAALALSAVCAVRSVAVSQGRVQPWPDKFLGAFVKMTTLCESHEVLVSAMQRPNELGFVFKHKPFWHAMKHWGSKLELHKLEQLVLVAGDAGLPPDYRMLYALVRACVNARQWEKLDEVLAWFRARGVTRYKPAMVKLLQQAAAAAAAEGNGNGSSSSSSGGSAGADAVGEGVDTAAATAAARESVPGLEGGGDAGEAADSASATAAAAAQQPPSELYE